MQMYQVHFICNYVYNTMLAGINQPQLNLTHSVFTFVYKLTIKIRFIKINDLQGEIPHCDAAQLL